jgi:polar amino acid transport system substrate-binding protein
MTTAEQTMRIGAILMAFCCAGAQAAPTETVTVGVFAVAPFIVAAEGGPRGILVDFFNQEIAPRMGVRFKWTAPVAVARLEQSLIHGAVDFSPILIKTPERLAAGIIYAGDVNVKFEPCIAVRADHALSAIASAADLAGMTIGWVQSGAVPDFLRDSRIRFDLVGAPNWEEINLAKLKAKRIDGAFFSDQFTPRYYGLQQGVNLKLLPLPALGRPLYAAFSPKAARSGLAARYEKAAREAFSKGRWEAFLDKKLRRK